MEEVNISNSLRAALEKYRVNRVYSRDTYNGLLSGYEKAIGYIDTLEVTVKNLQKKTIPTSDEIASMKAVLEMFGIEKLDMDGICKLTQIQSMIGGK